MMKKIFSVVALLLLINACAKDFELQNIDSELFVAAELSNNQVVINVQSEKIYPSGGYQITYNDKVRKNEICIDFKKLQVPDAGFAVLYPATCSIDLGKLEKGAYQIKFKLNKQETNGNLVIDTAADLTLEAGGNVKLN
jgi:hypothetical protein